MAYALIRDDPAWAEAGKLLDDPAPRMTVERDLFRASAEFARVQPEEFSEDALHVYRGMVAVGRLVDDPALIAEARSRLDGFLRRGFYHDGFWRQAEVQAHRRVLDLLEGWVGIMLAGEPDASRSMPANSSATLPHPSRAGSVAAGIPLIGLARAASATMGSRLADDQIQRATWSGVAAPVVNRRPVLLGGAGLARLAVGRSATALDLEVRGLDSYSGPHFQRLAMRLSAAGVPILDDLDECGATATGWELATASHNTVVVDGLNQRETPLMAGRPAAGSDFLFFAADPDFQVVSADDRRAYPQSASLYRQTLIVTASNRSCYAVSVFEVEGGLQHDQFFHAAPGRNDRWALTVPAYRPPPSLLPSSITFLPSARPEQGRWFVQSYGEFRLETQASLTGPSLVVLAGSGLPAGIVAAPGTSKVPGNRPASECPPAPAGRYPDGCLHGRQPRSDQGRQEEPARRRGALARQLDLAAAYRAGPVSKFQVRDRVRAGRQGVSASAAGRPGVRVARGRGPAGRNDRWPGICLGESETGNNPAGPVAGRAFCLF